MVLFDKKYMCPYCFEDISIKKLHYLCTNRDCKVSEDDELHAKWLDLPSFIRNQHVVTHHPKDEKCDLCRRTLNRRLCPECHNTLPQGIEDVEGIMLAVIGPKKVGKSVLITVLIQYLKTAFAKEFGTSLHAADENTSTKSLEDYKRMYENHQTPSGTTSGKADVNTRRPLVYYLKFINSKKTISLVFFDTAGEDMDNEDDMLIVNKYIAKASGIIFLVDPLQIPYVKKRIRVDNPPREESNMATILGRACNIIRSIRKMRQKDVIKTPLAVAFTKCDVIIRDPESSEESTVVLGSDSSLTIDRKKGVYDSVNFKQISAEIESYIDNITEGEFTQVVKANFSEYQYFALSALGSNPATDRIDRKISPVRIEDPLIWLLHKNGMIKKG
jgi:GTPase SAR1 family protein